MLSLYFVPYILLISGVTANVWVMLGLCVVMGLGMAGIGLSIMHDANHGAYSNKAWVNNTLGFTLNLIGGHAMNWKVQHNVLHHTYTNVHDVDEDISPRGILRMAPNPNGYPFTSINITMPGFYGLMTLVWVFVKILYA